MSEPLLDYRNPSLDAASVRDALRLLPHPEGGHYRELWRDRPASGGRGASSSILFLLAAGEQSHWHRIDAIEFWLWHAGAPLRLDLYEAAGKRTATVLGPDGANGQALQGVVPAFVWQSAGTIGAWSLVSCIVTPAFQFEGFELAPAGWTPPD